MHSIISWSLSRWIEVELVLKCSNKYSTHIKTDVNDFWSTSRFSKKDFVVAYVTIYRKTRLKNVTCDTTTTWKSSRIVESLNQTIKMKTIRSNNNNENQKQIKKLFIHHNWICDIVRLSFCTSNQIKDENLSWIDIHGVAEKEMKIKILKEEQEFSLLRKI